MALGTSPSDWGRRASIVSICCDIDLARAKSLCGDDGMSGLAGVRLLGERSVSFGLGGRSCPSEG